MGKVGDALRKKEMHVTFFLRRLVECRHMETVRGAVGQNY
jgi:hypothetical protein